MVRVPSRAACCQRTPGAAQSQPITFSEPRAISFPFANATAAATTHTLGMPRWLTPQVHKQLPHRSRRIPRVRRLLRHQVHWRTATTSSTRPMPGRHDGQVHAGLPIRPKPL